MISGIDSISVQRINVLHPKIRNAALTVLYSSYSADIPIRVTQGYRTFAQQEAIYNQGRDREGNIINRDQVVTYSKPGYSWHNYGLAFDFCILLQGGNATWDENTDINNNHQPDWLEVVEIAKKVGFEWGGDWPIGKKDSDHFEMRFGLTIEEALNRLESKKLDSRGYIII